MNKLGVISKERSHVGKSEAVNLILIHRPIGQKKIEKWLSRSRNHFLFTSKTSFKFKAKASLGEFKSRDGLLWIQGPSRVTNKRTPSWRTCYFMAKQIKLSLTDWGNHTHRYRSDLQFIKDAAGNFFNLFMLRALSWQ